MMLMTMMSREERLLDMINIEARGGELVAVLATKSKIVVISWWGWSWSWLWWLFKGDDANDETNDDNDDDNSSHARLLLSMISWWVCMHELISDWQRLSAFKDDNYDTDDEEEEEDDHWSKLRLSMKVSTLLSWRYIKECPIMVVVLVKMVRVINDQHSMRLTWQKSNFQSDGVKVSACCWLFKMQISNIFTNLLICWGRIDSTG